MREPVIHKGGWRACGKVAFYQLNLKMAGNIMTHNDLEWLDGHTPQEGEIIFCGSCNRAICCTADKEGRFFAYSLVPVLSEEEYQVALFTYKRSRRKVKKEGEGAH